MEEPDQSRSVLSEAGFHSAHPGLKPLLEFAPGNKKGGRTPTDAVPQPPPLRYGARLANRARLSAFHWRLSLGGCHPPTQLQAMLPGRRREYTILWTALRRRSCISPRALSAPACPSPGSQHPLRSLCRRADARSRSSARVTSPCPRAPRLAPAGRCHPAGVLHEGARRRRLLPGPRLLSSIVSVLGIIDGFYGTFGRDVLSRTTAVRKKSRESNTSDCGDLKRGCRTSIGWLTKQEYRGRMSVRSGISDFPDISTDVGKVPLD
jgi:hypothetical protein